MKLVWQCETTICLKYFICLVNENVTYIFTVHLHVANIFICSQFFN